MHRSKRTVCVVGAGASGLSAIRHALLYGFNVICYEGQSDIGGLWRYKDKTCDASSVMRSTIVNSSKELTAYSDFPPGADEGNFMHHSRLLEYLRSYAGHYDLIRHIQFNTNVTSIIRSECYEETGRWIVSTTNKVEDWSAGFCKNMHIILARMNCSEHILIRDLPTHSSTSTVFDAVLLCTGHHCTPLRPPPFQGEDTFQGHIIHSKDYKHPAGMEDKTVVVVGMGNSAADIAVELSRVVKQVYMVSRRGAWLRPRLGDNGYPMDCQLSTRLFLGFNTMLPSFLRESFARRRLNNRVDHAAYGVQPKHGVSNALPTTNDELPCRLATGTIKIVPDIECFTERGCRFVDGTVVEAVDEVILCTGFSFSFPILESGNLIQVKDNDLDLYKFIFPLKCHHDTVAIIGLIQGYILPEAELQARVALDVLVGRTKLPSMEERQRDVDKRRKAMSSRFVGSPRHTLQVDHIAFMDELADVIGCTPPSWTSCLFSDPQLSMALLCTPIAAYFYRLRGPHPWDGAREAILGIEERIAKGNYSKARLSNSFMFLYYALFILGALLSVVFLWILSSYMN